MLNQETLVAVSQHLQRAKGCIVDYNTQAATIETLLLQVAKLESALAEVDTAKTEITNAEEIRQSLNFRQKIRSWFRNAWKDILKWLGWGVAAILAGYTIYQTITP